ncbi:MAG: ATP-binding cassette domain-containing protein [Verrucomicrobiales bacterium]|nr:ATP-binding cassette domain-containing protein [Verrucomicrobiales bacterium]
MTTGPNKTPHLDIGDLHCSPPARPALRGVSLAVSHGSFFGIAGANGSGKGTLCRCLARLHKEDQGRILLNGQSLPHRAEDLPAIGMMIVLQGAKVFPEMSVLDNLLCAPATWRNGDRREKLDAVMQLLPHLKDRFRQNGGTLSGGEQQMVAIGRALMAEPSLLVLEEPSLGLAAKTANDVYRTLAQISGEGRTVIVTEETLTLASRYINEACSMSQGKITHVGSPQHILDGMTTHEFTPA